jgi:hypothetical protein
MRWNECSPDVECRDNDDEKEEKPVQIHFRMMKINDKIQY